MRASSNKRVECLQDSKLGLNGLFVTDKLVKFATITSATGVENRHLTAKVVGPRSARPGTSGVQSIAAVNKLCGHVTTRSRDDNDVALP